MPNIVQLWDFEDGTTQGWELGSNTTLDANSELQGTYSLKFAPPEIRSATYTSISSISNVDLSSTAKPMLVLVVKLRFYRANYAPYWKKGSIIVRINGTTDFRYLILNQTAFPKAGDNTWYRIIAVDLSEWQGQTIDIELLEYHEDAIWDREDTYICIDMIAVIDGADYEYNTGIVTFDNDDLTVSLDIPSSDGDLSGMSVPKVAVSLATPDWDYTNISLEEVDSQGTLKIDPTDNLARHCNYVERGTAMSSFQKVNIHVWGLSIGDYAGWMEKIAVVFLDGSWSYKRIYLFNIYFTANGADPRYVNSINTTTYGSTVSGSKDINIRVHGNSLEIALWVKYIVGDHAIVSSGSVTMEIFNSDKTTSYGSVSVDLTASDDQTSSYITGLPTDENLVITLSWSITANGRVVILACPLVKVS